MRLKIGEVTITQAKNPAAFKLAGLAYDTKFDFKVIVDLPWSDRYFKVSVRNPPWKYAQAWNMSRDHASCS
jgi:hypothetical protein